MQTAKARITCTSAKSDQDLHWLYIESLGTIEQIGLYNSDGWYGSLLFAFHYEITPIQIYWKFHHKKLKIFR